MSSLPSHKLVAHHLYHQIWEHGLFPHVFQIFTEVCLIWVRHGDHSCLVCFSVAVVSSMTKSNGKERVHLDSKSHLQFLIEESWSRNIISTSRGWMHRRHCLLAYSPWLALRAYLYNSGPTIYAGVFLPIVDSTLPR